MQIWIFEELYNSELREVYKMYVEYKTKKDLPCNELYQLFLAVGWAKEDETHKQ